MEQSGTLFELPECDAAPWPDAFGLAVEDILDADAFALADGLDLDEELDNAASEAAPKPQGQSKSQERMDRTRARNRLAQARYRQRTKERLEELDASISRKKEAVSSCLERKKQLQSQHTQLTARCSNSVAARNAILSVSNMIASAPVHASVLVDSGFTGTAANAQQPQPPIPPKPPAPNSAADTMPSVSPPVTAPTPTEVVATNFSHHVAGSLLFAPTRAQAPRSLTSFQHHRPISVNLVDPVGYPEASEDTPSVVHNSCGTASSFKGGLQHYIEEFRTKEAQRCGCGVSDIAWFIQTHMKVADCNQVDQNSIPGVCVGPVHSEMLSVSSTFSSAECAASFALLYVHGSVENSATVRAQDILAGVAPEDIAESLTKGGQADKETGTSSSYCATNMQQSTAGDAIGQHKRKQRRHVSGAIDPSATRPKPVKSMAEIMAQANFTGSYIDACHVRCGVGALVPVRAAVKKLFRGTVRSMCGILPLNILSLLFESFIETVDQALFGITSKRGASVESCQPSARGPVVCSSTSAAASDVAERSGGSSEEQYKKEYGVHLVSVILAAREEFMALLEDMPALIAETPKSEWLTTRAQLLHRNKHYCNDLMCSKIVGALDSPKHLFELMMDAFQPFLGHYYQVKPAVVFFPFFLVGIRRPKGRPTPQSKVDSMQLQQYKAIKPNDEQRSCMTELWERWERRKRQLDGEMHAVHMQLASVPSHIPLPHDFLSHLNALAASPPADEPHKTLTGGKEGRESPPTRKTPSATGPMHCSTWLHANPPDTWKQNAGLPIKTHSSDLLRSPASEGLMGQYPDTIERAERALQGLSCVLAVEQLLYVDVLNARMPGAVLDMERCQRLSADHFTQQLMPPEFLQLCQACATQQNRFRLFVEPFQ